MSSLLENLTWQPKQVILEGESEITKDARVGVEGGLAQSIGQLSSGFVWSRYAGSYFSSVGSLF